MNRLVYLLFALPLFTSFITTVQAGPACARRNEGTDACIQLCKDKWGWPGFQMGTDRWGSVLTKTVTKTNDMGAVITQACRVRPSSSTTSSSTSASVTSTPIANVIASASLSTVKASPSLRPLAANTTSIDLKLATTTRTSSSTSTRTATPSTTPLAKTSTSSTSTKPRPTTTSKPAPPPAPTTTSTPPPKPTTTAKPATTTSKAPAPKTTSQAPATDGGSGSSSSSGATSQSDINAYLQGHNSVRSQHGAAALTWSDDLAAKAQQWADGCVFQHSGGTLGKFGENLAAGTGSSYGIAPAIKSWTDEVSDYDPSNPQASHFTQVVWKGTQQVGCAVQSCNGIFPASFGAAKYFVCEYFPQGNIIGAFDQNVQA